MNSSAYIIITLPVLPLWFKNSPECSYLRCYEDKIVQINFLLITFCFETHAFEDFF